MEQRRKKIIIISSVIGLLILGGLAYYYFYPGGDKTINDIFGRLPGLPDRRIIITPPPKPKPPKTKEELEREARLIQIVSKPIISPTLSKDGAKILYYAKAGGNLEAVGLDGKNEEKISNITILGLLEALWQNPDKGAAILTYIESGSGKRFISSTATSGVIFLPANVIAANWSYDGKEIAYFINQKESFNLTIADEKAQKPTVVYSTPIPDFNIFWTSKNKILLASRPSGAAPGILFYFDRTKKAFNKIFSEAYGLTILPSPDGQNMLYAQTVPGGGNLKLYLAKIDGSESQEIEAQTLPEKCVFKNGGVSVFCAAPKNISAFGILPDDWYMGKGFFQDRFIEIITATTTASASPAVKEVFNEKEFDAVNLFLSLDTQFLFFQDKKDGTLWRLKL